MTAPDLSQIDTLTAEHRLGLVRTNHDAILACLANTSHFSSSTSFQVMDHGEQENDFRCICEVGSNPHIYICIYTLSSVLYLRTLMACTELDVAKILPLDILEFCISKKYEASALAVSGIWFLSSFYLGFMGFGIGDSNMQIEPDSFYDLLQDHLQRPLMFSPTVALHCAG